MITDAISKELRIPFEEAEKLKIKEGLRLACHEQSGADRSTART